METLGEFLAQFDGMDRDLPIMFSCSIDSGMSMDTAMESAHDVTLNKIDIVYQDEEDEDEDEVFTGVDEDGDEIEGNRIVYGPVVVIHISGQRTNSQ